MKITQMTGRTGKAVPNQFIITDKGSNGVSETLIFQSYKTEIAIIEKTNGNIDAVYLDRDAWNYSKTTSKYRNQFLNETTKETQAKIDSGEYILTDLN